MTFEKLVFVISFCQSTKTTMKIVQVKPLIVSQNLSQPFSFSQWEYSKRTICLVKITTDNGIVGWGEGYGPAEVIKGQFNLECKQRIEKETLTKVTLTS